jgi:hypothetical protein
MMKIHFGIVQAIDLSTSYFIFSGDDGTPSM